MTRLAALCYTVGMPATNQLNRYQKTELAKLTNNGWTICRVRRLQNDLNPWASVDMRDPNGDRYLTALPTSAAEARWLADAI